MEREATSRPGRPPKAPEQRHSVLVRVMVTPEEQRIIQEAAEIAQAESVSAFVRQSVVNAARAQHKRKGTQSSRDATHT